jgi:predicted acyltransferase
VTQERLISLDAFRGFTIASMVLVNNPGDWGNLYRQLGHAEWNGWTFTDWVFPFFLFIVGVAMTFSLARRQVQVHERLPLVLSLWKRAAIIIGIGLLLNLIPNFNFETVRIPGVLQRIGMCIVLAAPLVVYTGWREQATWIFICFLVYSILMLAVPVTAPDGVTAAGVLEPGRDFGAAIDRLLLSGHLWAKAKTWDPEGLVSTLPAVSTLLFGVLTGHWLAAKRDAAEKTVWMLLAGLLCLWIGAMMDAVFMPINKSLWTPSYSVFMTGWALIVFAAFYWLMDAVDSEPLRTKSRKWFLPFTIYGMNALFIFAFSGLVAKMMGFIKVGEPALPLKALAYAPVKALPLAPVNTSLIFAVLFNLAMFAVAWFMWKRKWFVKV